MVMSSSQPSSQSVSFTMSCPLQWRHKIVESLVTISLYYLIFFVTYHCNNPFYNLQSTLKQANCIIFNGNYDFSDGKYISIKVENHANSLGRINILLEWIAMKCFIINYNSIPFHFYIFKLSKLNGEFKKFPIFHKVFSVFL